MLQHVWERASLARYLTSVVIATDDARIEDAAREFGARVVRTRDDHLSGTDRVAEAASASNAQFVVNVQGDEPMIDPAAIDAAILGILEQDEAPMATIKTKIRREADLADPNVVKVAADLRGNAIFFSRLPIPFAREAGERPAYFKHLGLYVYEREFLLSYSDLPVGPLERAERLEQLRALENGFKIRVVETDYDSLGVDTPEDYKQVAELFEQTMVNR
jgi:3-deoxy-manno-octulosonate cytidylyltransferase (CMP-KDO synthetase)